MPDLDRKIDLYVNHGGCPVKWAHHPKPIKDKLRAIGLRPMMKSCFRNCQQFFLYADDLDLEYHEGWIVCSVGVPIQHAWLVWQGQRIDLTLDDNRIEYVSSYKYDRKQVVKAIFKNGTWSPVNEPRLYLISPFYEMMSDDYKEKLNKFLERQDGKDGS
jgi:hypothetical protein